MIVVTGKRRLVTSDGKMHFWGPILDIVIMSYKRVIIDTMSPELIHKYDTAECIRLTWPRPDKYKIVRSRTDDNIGLATDILTMHYSNIIV